jgi:hypothetical protein
VWLLIAVFVVIAVFLDAGAVASLGMQESANVGASSEGRVRLRLTATGVHWVALSNWDLSWFYATFEWIRYLRHSERTWTVAIASGWAKYDAPALRTEEFSDRKAASRRLSELAVAIEQGILTLDPGSTSRTEDE